MARPINADADATRERILRAAIARFADVGRGGTSVRDIASGAGVSVGMISHHFGGKDALFERCTAAIVTEIASLRDTLSPELLGAESLEDGLRRTMRVAYAFARSHRDASRFALRVVLESGELEPRRRDELLVPFLDAASALIASRTGRDPKCATNLRLGLQSLVFLVGRYAIASERELRAVLGAPDGVSPEALHGCVATHLEELALVTLLGPSR